MSATIHQLPLAIPGTPGPRTKPRLAKPVLVEKRQAEIAEKPETLPKAPRFNVKAAYLDERKQLKRLEQQITKLRHEKAQIMSEFNNIDRLTFGDWYLMYGAQEVRKIPPGTNPDCVWTWVDGPRFNGDIDVIIPGSLPDLAHRLFVTRVPFPGGRLLVSCYTP